MGAQCDSHRAGHVPAMAGAVADIWSGHGHGQDMSGKCPENISDIFGWKQCNVMADPLF